MTLSPLPLVKGSPPARIETGQHSYVHKRGNKLTARAAGRNRLTRSQRAQARLKTKRHLTALAAELGDNKLASKIVRCSSKVGFLSCGQHEHKKVTNYHCQFRLCPHCAERRSRDLFRKYFPVVLAFVQRFKVTPVHLVLTQPQREGETAKQSRQRLLDAFSNLIRRDFWKEHFKGGMWSLEIKLAKDKDGIYHTHLHILAFRTKMFSIRENDNKFRDEWREVSGAENFRLDPITDLRRGLTEVLKYISKPLDIERFTAKTLREFLEMRNSPFVNTFGEFRKFASKFELPEADADQEAETTEKINYGELAEGSLCPDCAQPLFELRMSEEEYIHYLQRIELCRKETPPPKQSNV